MNSVGTRLAYFRKKCGYTLSEAADMVGISRNTLASYESGKTKLPLSAAIKLINLYNCDVYDIFEVHAAKDDVLAPYEIAKIQAGCAVLREMNTGILNLPDEYYKKKFKSYVVHHMNKTQFAPNVSEDEIDKDTEELFRETFLKE